MKRTRRWLGLLGAAMLVTACDSGPKGPGALSTVVSGPDLGAVVLQVAGSGIRGFEGQDGSKVFSTALSPNAVVPSYRVIVVGQNGGDLHFGIQVDDRGGQLPTVSVLQAVDADNASVSGSGLEVRIAR